LLEARSIRHDRKFERVNTCVFPPPARIGERCHDGRWRRASVSQGASPCVRRSVAGAWSRDRREHAMSNTILLPFQPDSMSRAQLAAVSYLARYSGHTHSLYAYQPGGGSGGARPTGWTRSGSTAMPRGARLPGDSRPSEVVLTLCHQPSAPSPFTYPAQVDVQQRSIVASLRVALLAPPAGLEPDRTQIRKRSCSKLARRGASRASQARSSAPPLERSEARRSHGLLSHACQQPHGTGRKLPRVSAGRTSKRDRLVDHRG